MDLHALSNTSAMERQLIDEVRYLHSLYRQGPPQNPNPNPNLRPLSVTAFKKKKKKKKKRKEQHLDIEQTPSTRSDPPPEPRIRTGWDEPPPKPRPWTGWGDPKPHPVPASTRPATAEEQAKLAAVKLQRNVLKSCQDFFSKKDSFDSEEDDEEEDDDLMEDGEGESENFKFFLGIFSNDDALRNYYEKNFECGEFFCLACGGIGKKAGKRYGNCVGLVQHSTFISKRKGKNAHRAFAKVVCRVLGWNIKRLPNIVLDLREPLSKSLDKAKSQVNIEEVGLGEAGAVNQEKPSQVVDSVGTDKGELMEYTEK